MTEQPTYMTREVRAALACLSCGRVAATATHPKDGGPTTFSLVRVEDAEYVKRRRCPQCFGSLWVGEREVVTTFHRLPPEVVNPKPGRPKSAAKDVPCSDCGATRRHQGNTRYSRCHPCARRRIAAEADDKAREVVEVLAGSDRPIGSHELAQRLGCDSKGARDRVKLARGRGVRIVTTGKQGYSLEVAS